MRNLPGKNVLGPPKKVSKYAPELSIIVIVCIFNLNYIQVLLIFLKYNNLKIKYWKQIIYN